MKISKEQDSMNKIVRDFTRIGVESDVYERLLDIIAFCKIDITNLIKEK